jgi:hypothetical protein
MQQPTHNTNFQGALLRLLALAQTGRNARFFALPSFLDLLFIPPPPPPPHRRSGSAGTTDSGSPPPSQAGLGIGSAGKEQKHDDAEGSDLDLDWLVFDTGSSFWAAQAPRNPGLAVKLVARFLRGVARATNAAAAAARADASAAAGVATAAAASSTTSASASAASAASAALHCYDQRLCLSFLDSLACALAYSHHGTLRSRAVETIVARAQLAAAWNNNNNNNNDQLQHEQQPLQMQLQMPPLPLEPDAEVLEQAGLGLALQGDLPNVARLQALLAWLRELQLPVDAAQQQQQQQRSRCLLPVPSGAELAQLWRRETAQDSAFFASACSSSSSSSAVATSSWPSQHPGDEPVGMSYGLWLRLCAMLNMRSAVIPETMTVVRVGSVAQRAKLEGLAREMIAAAAAATRSPWSLAPVRVSTTGSGVAAADKKEGEAGDSLETRTAVLAALDRLAAPAQDFHSVFVPFLAADHPQ